MTEKSGGKRVRPGEKWVAARIPEWAEERLKEWSVKQDRSASWLIRWAVLHAFEEGIDKSDEPLKMPEIDK